MKKLAEGTILFKDKVFEPNKALFENLAKEQNPVALMITCCDSRVEPVIITQSSPGTLFTVKNIGNMVPVFNGHNRCYSEAAAIEYALTILNVRHIIVYGHTDCGAMKALLALDTLPKSSPIYQWLKPNRHILELVAHHEDPAHQLNELIWRNIIQQLNNLTTYPEVMKRLQKGTLQLYGWEYYLETGETVLIDSMSSIAEPMTSVLPYLVPEEYPKISLGQIERNVI